METSLERKGPAAVDILQFIASATSDPAVDVSKVRELLEMRRQILKDAAEVEFRAALARVQAEMPRISKQGKIVVPGRDGKTGHSTPYALYEDVDTGLRPLLEREGFSVSFSAEPGAGGSIWHCLLAHRDGHQERYSTPPLPADQTGSKNAVQAIMSSNKYARRYLLCNIFNIVTIGADDDGNATSYLTEAQVMNMTDLLNEQGIKPGTPRHASFLSFAEADSVSHIQQGRYDRVMAAIRQKPRGQQ